MGWLPHWLQVILSRFVGTHVAAGETYACPVLQDWVGSPNHPLPHTGPSVTSTRTGHSSVVLQTDQGSFTLSGPSLIQWWLALGIRNNHQRFFDESVQWSFLPGLRSHQWCLDQVIVDEHAMCGQVRPLLAELLATALFLTLASLGPGPRAISWGVSYALSTLLAGPQAALNPALSLAMVASRQVSLLGQNIQGTRANYSVSGETLHLARSHYRPVCWGFPFRHRPDPHLSLNP